PKDKASSRFAAIQSAGLLIFAGVVLVVFIAYSIGIRIPGMTTEPQEKTVQAPPPLAVRLVSNEPRTLTVPEEVRVSLGIRKGERENVEVVQPPSKGRPLVLHGSTQLDPTRIMRIRARFAPAEVVEIGQVPIAPGESKSGRTEFREL